MALFSLSEPDPCVSVLLLLFHCVFSPCQQHMTDLFPHISTGMQPGGKGTFLLWPPTLDSFSVWRLWVIGAWVMSSLPCSLHREQLFIKANPTLAWGFIWELSKVENWREWQWQLLNHVCQGLCCGYPVTCGHVPCRVMLLLTFNLWPSVFVHLRSMRGFVVLLLIVEFKHRKWSLRVVCIYVGQWVCQGADTTQGPS